MAKTAWRNVRDRVLARMRDDDFSGADPFDGLESGLLRASGMMRFRLARLAWLQTIKRGPDMLRRAAMIAPLCNAKTLALLGGAGDGVRVLDMRDRLISMQNADGGWGYPFAWQARAFYAARGQSNAIVTSFAVDALHAAGMTGKDPAMRRAGAFVREKLWREGYFAYIARNDAEIHNVSLWAAYALHVIDPKQSMSRQAVDRVLQARKPDGSWAYGTRSHHRFIDGFHTGYVLDLLDRFRQSGMVGLDTAIEEGYAFYRQHCFDDDGLPRSLAAKGGYRDAHAVAQAIGTLCRFGEAGHAGHVADWAVETLFDATRDVFFAGIGRFGPDRRNYMRWTQAWMVWALSIVIEAPPMSDVFDPTKPLTFAHPDPHRAQTEAKLHALSEAAFRDLFRITRNAAAEKRACGEMDSLYMLTRGLKTLQRIGGQRGIILAAGRGGT